MQKLKKSLKNNLLNSYIKDSFFVLTNVKKLESNINSQKFYISQNLTKNTINQLDINLIIDVSVLKFPIQLKIFETFNRLKINLRDESAMLKIHSPIVVKANNLIFKNKTYELLICNYPNSQVFKLKNSIYPIVSVILLLKLYLSLKKCSSL